METLRVIGCVLMYRVPSHWLFVSRSSVFGKLHGQITDRAEQLFGSRRHFRIPHPRGYVLTRLSVSGEEFLIPAEHGDSPFCQSSSAFRRPCRRGQVLHSNRPDNLWGPVSTYSRTRTASHWLFISRSSAFEIRIVKSHWPWSGYI
jgi:hypothetical protein